MLSELGLASSEADDRVYRYLLGVDRATPEAVAAALDLEPEAVTTALGTLQERGLAFITADAAALAPTVGPGSSWAATPPELALTPVVSALRDRLRRAETAMVDLAESYRRDRIPAAVDLVEVLEGREPQVRRIHQLEHDATDSVWVFQTGFNTVVPVPTTFTDQQPPAREPDAPDVEYRVIVDSAFLSEPEAVRALDERLASGHHVRVVDHPLMKLAIADGELAIMQVNERASIAIRAPLTALAVELFESTWRRSRPYLPEGNDLDQMDRRVLQLMIAGLTDSATAAQVGTSTRTVQRRLRSLMDAAGVTSRVQLGWYAMRNNWV